MPGRMNFEWSLLVLVNVGVKQLAIGLTMVRAQALRHQQLL